MKKCRKIAYIPISPQIILNILKKGGTLEAKSLPEDCKYVLSQYDFIRDLFLIAVESNSFECIKEGEKIPEIEDITLSYVPLKVNELKERISKILSILIDIIKEKENEKATNFHFHFKSHFSLFCRRNDLLLPKILQTNSLN